MKTVFQRAKFSIFAFVVLFLSLAAPSAFAYDWIVYFPSSVEYAKCEIIAYGSDGNQNIFTITPGQTITSHFANNVSYIDGRCNMASWGPTYFTRIQGRTCDGIDFKDSMPGGKSCANNITIKICKKGDGVGEWSHGFCPN